MIVKRGELIVGHIPRQLSKRLAFSVVEARAHGGGGGGGGSDVMVTGDVIVHVMLAFLTVLSG